MRGRIIGVKLRNDLRPVGDFSTKLAEEFRESGSDQSYLQWLESKLKEFLAPQVEVPTEFTRKM